MNPLKQSVACDITLVVLSYVLLRLVGAVRLLMAPPRKGQEQSLAGSGSVLYKARKSTYWDWDFALRNGSIDASGVCDTNHNSSNIFDGAVWVINP
jgi:hypothetical protein